LPKVLGSKGEIDSVLKYQVQRFGEKGPFGEQNGRAAVAMYGVITKRPAIVGQKQSERPQRESVRKRRWPRESNWDPTFSA
jgi:hypothetical protein